MSTSLLSRSGVVILAFAVTACAGRVSPVVSANQGTADIAQLWVEPADLEARDLFYGPGGEALAPNPAARFEFV